MHIEMEFLCAKPFLDVCGHSYDIGISTGVPLVEKKRRWLSGHGTVRRYLG
jgi:hypothetical protein